MAAVMVLVSAGPAQAATDPPTADVVTSVWRQPGTAPLDGLGTYVYVLPPQAPGPGQGSPAGYEYTLNFHLEDGSFGVIALGHQNGQKVAGFGVLPTTLVSTVPYDWKYGQAYFLFTYRLSSTQWGAWVLDWATSAWTLIAVHTVPATAGRMLPEAATSVDYDLAGPLPAGAATTCAFYPRIDALFYAPMGWRGQTVTGATFKERAGFDGECPSTTTPMNAWHWYTVGQTA